MKIILLTDGIYPYVMGGMQKHSYYLTKYLAKNRVEVELYHCVANDKSLVEELEGFTKEELNFINHHCFHFPKLDSFPGHYLRENRRLSELYLEHYAIRTTDSSTSQSSAQNDVFSSYIYVQGFTGRAFIDAKQKGIELPDIIVNFHGLEMFQKAPSFRVKLEHLLLRKAVKYNVQNADNAVSLGGRLTAVLNNIKAKNVVEIPIGIEENWLVKTNEGSKKNIIKFVFIGRYERRKGIEELSEVISALNNEISPLRNSSGRNDVIEFHFIGPIPNKFKFQSSKFKVVYHGELREEEAIKEILQGCDVLVSPSWSEGMPTVILEAMASGCAIIATDVGAVSEQVDKSNGWLIEPGDKKQLKNVIIEAINTSQVDLKQKKINSIERIKSKFLWNDVIKTTIHKLF